MTNFGGALAAGGLGMAGGTAIIAGGGAALGLASGGGATVITALLTGTKGEFALDECAKLLTFCKEVLGQDAEAKDSIAWIRYELSSQIERMKIQWTVLSECPKDPSLSKEEKKKVKNELASFEKSLRYMRKCEKEICKLVGDGHRMKTVAALNGVDSFKAIEE